MFVNTDLPTDLVEAIDRLKIERGVSSRSVVIEDAVRFYIENAKELRA